MLCPNSLFVHDDVFCARIPMSWHGRTEKIAETIAPLAWGGAGHIGMPNVCGGGITRPA